MRRHPTAAVLVSALAVSLLLGACGGDDDDTTGGDATTTEAAASTSGESTTVPDESTTTVEAATSTSAGDTSTTAPAATTSPGSDLDLDDGKHPVYITAIDVGAHTMTFDVIQFLTGQDAVDAYQAANPGDPEGPPNDYFILNENPKLRTAPVAATPTVMLVRLSEDSDADLDPGTFEELPAYLAASPPGDGGALSAFPYWLTVTGGTVTAIEEQYLP